MFIEDYIDEAFENGLTCRVDFERRNLTVSGTKLIVNGEIQGDFQWKKIENETTIIPTLEYLYRRYKHSLPSIRSENRKRRYFTALKMDELSDEDIFCPVPREKAMADLETVLLQAIISGAFSWKDDYGSWFWRGSDPDFVILKSWVVNH